MLLLPNNSCWGSLPPNRSCCCLGCDSRFCEVTQRTSLVTFLWSWPYFLLSFSCSRTMNSVLLLGSCQFTERSNCQFWPHPSDFLLTKDSMFTNSGELSSLCGFSGPVHQILLPPEKTLLSASPNHGELLKKDS